MKIEQLYTKCLSQGSYYIISDSEVAIIDPLRETNQYIEKAAKDQIEDPKAEKKEEEVVPTKKN